MPRISPQELFKGKQALLEKEKQERIARNSAQKSVQNSALIIEQEDVQLSAQKSMQQVAHDVYSEGEKSNKEISDNTVSKSNDALPNELEAKLQKLADKISQNEIQSELFRDRTVLPRTSYTLSEEIVEIINSFYTIIKKKDKRVSKQDAAEIILRQFFKDCIKTSKSRNKN